MILLVLVPAFLIQSIVFAQVEYTTPEAPKNPIDIRAVISRLNDVLGLGMNINKIVEDYKANQKNGTTGYQTQNQYGNEQKQECLNGMSLNNQYAQTPQSNYDFQNNMQQQYPQGYAPGGGNVGGKQNDGFMSQNGISNNLPNQFVPQPNNQGSLGGNMQISGGGQQPYAQQSRAGMLAGNYIPNRLPNQFAPLPNNQGSLGGNMQISGGGQQPYAQQSGAGMLAGNYIPNNLPNQFAPQPNNQGSLGGNMQISVGGHQNSQLGQNGIPSDLDSHMKVIGKNAQNEKFGTFDSQAPEILAKKFGMGNTQNEPIGSSQRSPNQFANGQRIMPNMFNQNQMEFNGQNGQFNAMPFGVMGNSMARNGPINNPQMSPNQFSNGQDSLFKMYQQSMSNPYQMANNQNENSQNGNINANAESNLFNIYRQSMSNQKYSGLSNFDMESGNVKQQQQYTPSPQTELVSQQQLIKQQPETQQKDQNQLLQKELKQQACNIKQQESKPNDAKKNKEVDDFIKRMFGNDVFDYARKELNFREETIGKNKYPATEESIFKRVTGDADFLTNDRFATPSTLSGNYKMFHILKHPEEPIDKVQKKVLWQNEWVKADENKLNVFFKDVKKDQEDKLRDEMYGRVKRGVIIDEAIGENDKTTRRTHIYEDIQVGLNDWLNFGRQKSEEIYPNTTFNGTQNSKSKREIPIEKQKLQNEDNTIAKYAQLKKEESNNIISTFINYHENQKQCDRDHKKGNIRQRNKRNMDEVLEKLSDLEKQESNNMINKFLDYHEEQKHNFHYQGPRRQRNKRNVDEDEIMAKLGELEKEESNNMINNFLDYHEEQRQNVFHQGQRRQRNKRYVDEEEVVAKLGDLEKEESNNMINNFLDYHEEQRQNVFHQGQRRQRNKRNVDEEEVVAKLGDLEKEESNNLIYNFLDYHEEQKQNIRKYGLKEDTRRQKKKRNIDEVVKKLGRLEKEESNNMINKFLDYHEEQKDNNQQNRYKRNVPNKLSRQRRQSKSTDDLALLKKDLSKKADRISRMNYNSIFPELLKDFETFREQTYSKALRNAYRSNGWPAKEFKVPENPQEVLPQVFRHFKYVSKTNLEEYYFIMMLRLPKLIKLYHRTLNIIDRGFKEPTNSQLQGYMNRETEIEKDFAEFSKLLRSKIFNSYLEFEDRYNEESPKFFYLETMPPFNKDPTAPPEMEKFKVS